MLINLGYKEKNKLATFDQAKVSRTINVSFKALKMYLGENAEQRLNVITHD